MTTRILLIEDNEQNRYLVTYLLELHGYSVTHAADGRAGIDVASREPFDLILLDIQLPVMDGRTVACTLRSNLALAHMPIVAVTSYAMAGDREKLLAEGFDGYLEKPIDPVTFVADVARHLRPSAKGTPA